MSESSISLSGGLPNTVLPPLPESTTEALAAAGDDRTAIAAFVAEHPRVSDGWAALGDATDTPIDRYAAYRVGYHRGLDSLRAAGWRGSGYVRWTAPSNRGFLRCLAGLQQMALAIGETDEAQRCAQFLVQLDPDWSSRSAE